MTPEQKELVQSNWKDVEPISETAADLFYGKLFELDPAVRSMFKGDMKEQGKKLMQMIGVAVHGLDNLGELTPAIAAMGKRHTGYGVEDSHYETVGEALLWTLDQGLGEKFTADAKEAWTIVYTTLATVMKDAASETGTA
jgi:hemoglobin-like flavoprotein